MYAGLLIILANGLQSVAVSLMYAGLLTILANGLQNVTVSLRQAGLDLQTVTCSLMMFPVC